MVSEILFGEHFSILEKQDNWLKIQLLNDEYVGWIDLKLEPKKVFENCTHIVCKETRLKNGIRLYPGSFLSSEMLEQNAHLNADFIKPIAEKRSIENLSNIFSEFFRTPYYWGGKTTRGTDCSGFVQICFACIGISLPRDAYQQAAIGKEIVWENRKFGDLAFFENDLGKITHVGICLNDNQIVHASEFVRIDTLKPDGIYTTNTHKKSHQLSFIKRISN